MITKRADGSIITDAGTLAYLERKEISLDGLTPEQCERLGQRIDRLLRYEQVERIVQRSMRTYFGDDPEGYAEALRIAVRMQL